MTNEELEKLIVQEAGILSSPPAHLIGTGAAQRYAEGRLRALIKAVQPEGNALTEQEFAKIEAELIGPGRAYGFVHVTYCHVCGNNVEYGHMDDCPWAKAKALLSPLAPSKKESP